MESFDTAVISRGRITIPQELREKLKISDGDFVRVQVTKLVVKEAVQ